tara:strand:- start:1057 stop:1257 length:201 start_codon:yes stop_codon:yes gene_type:complete
MARTKRSAAPNRLAGSHKGPLNAIAGGGSMDTINNAPAVIRNGMSVVCSGARARMNPDKTITMIAA